ncbi:ABC transporter ATP-binding protein [Lederbergia lenta]|uniref:Carnitine transport ATP-binding protein OpuCA n=1 Tax=Lederbergia lenta TaxID=1467 RepID=A0A2X4VNH8_LEDLE|nr:ABC transporter ATP-binding protein [Lederbergia lenta]MCM3110817.1 ABC transporter ATP-binding protein [Lederbergia lenta]MEC2325788.1 ABC transporter ATP-binding protein [Lederbergia lenta]SQI53747.1 proline/glycine betaine ABC transporter ATP-binding protein [Lederbergia lenta]
MIKFQNVIKTYEGNVRAIDNVSFNVEDGEFVILLGPSGCGKTTLLRMVNQLETITDGDIILNDKSVRHSNIIEMRRNIGYVIQSNGLFPNMTIEDNVLAVPNLIGWDRAKQQKRYSYLMDLIGLNPDEYRKRYPHELSGGQQQRIGVARALAADPPVMLMDEPFGALDPIIRTRLQEEFLQIQREVKKTILFVSHDIDEAVKMGDRIALFRDGKIMQYDRPAEILSHPNNDFVSEFIGNDRMLKSMSLYTVKDLSNVCSLQPNITSEDIKIIKENTSLRTAISLLLNQEADQLVIEDENGNNMGSLTFDLINEFLRKEVRGSKAYE